MCEKWDFPCLLKGAAGNVAGGVAEQGLSGLANSVLESVGRAASEMTTLWVGIPTPNLTSGGSGRPVAGWDNPPEAEGITSVLSYSMTIALGLVVVSLMAWGARFAWSRSGDGERQMGRLGLILSAAVLISAAVAIVTVILPSPDNRVGATPSAPVAFIQDSLWMYTAALAVLAVFVGAGKMVWNQDAQPGKDLMQGILTLALVSVLGLTVVSVLVKAADEFSKWILDGAVKCELPDPSTGCFGKGVMEIFAPLAASGIGVFAIIAFGIAAWLMTITQIMLMLGRAAMLVLLAGTLPISAAATNTEMGKQWFKKHVAWLIAFIMYKPAVAIIYATSMKLVGSNNATGDAPIVAMASGLVLMLLAIVALPALLRFITPMAAAMGGAGGAMAGAAAMALPTGAMEVARMSGGGESGSGSSDGPSGASQDSGGGPSGADTNPTGGSSSDGGGSNDSGGGTPGGSDMGSADSGGDSTPVPAGSPSGGSDSAAGSTGGAETAAEATPVGAAVGAGVQAAEAGAEVAQDVAAETTDSE